MPHIFSTIIEHVVLIKQENPCIQDVFHQCTPNLKPHLASDESSSQSLDIELPMNHQMNIPRLQTEASQSKSDMYRQKYSDMLNISIRQSVQSFRIVVVRWSER